MNILDYVSWRGDLPIDEKTSPFNELDAVVLARFSYMPSGCIDSVENVTIHDFVEKLKGIPDNDERKKFLLPDDPALLSLLENSERFREMTISDYVNDVDKQTETQFCAITLKILPKTHFISFRGTDSTLVGWKEDFNMCFTSPVSAQILSVKYVNSIFEKYDGDFIVGGHSKGGNLAIYASSFCESRYQNRISSIYNFDGPGFDDSVLSSIGYLSISHKINTYVPQSSVIGMMLDRKEEKRVVHSTQESVRQHDLYSWQVIPVSLERIDTDVDTMSRFVDQTLKAWASDRTPEEREIFIDTIYNLLDETDAGTIAELKENKISNIIKVMKSMKDLDKDTTKLLSDTFDSLFKSAKRSLKGVIK